MQQKELQKEFTEFVKQIIEQINKDIYLEDLKKLYDSYLSCLNGLNTEAEYMTKVSFAMHENQRETVSAIIEIQKDLTEKTKQIESALAIFYDGYEQILQKYENNIIALNEKERVTFTEEIASAIQNTKSESIENTRVIFEEYINKLQEMSDSVAKTEDLEKIVAEMTQTRDIVQRSVSTTYLQTLTEFEKRIATLNAEERKALSFTIKTLFQKENETLKATIKEYESLLDTVASKMMTHQDIETFKKSLAQYTNAIQYLAEQRYSEGIRMFEARLSQIGAMHFEKYLESIQQTTLKASDLEALSEQIKLLVLSMKQQLKTSEISYQQIFEEIKSGVETLNTEESEKFVNTLSDFFKEQMLRLNEIFHKHERVIEEYQKEQKNVRWTVEKIQDTLEEQEEHTKELLQFLQNTKKQEQKFEDKIVFLNNQIQQQNLKQEQLLHQMQKNTKNISALFILNVIQFCIIILLFFISGETSFVGILQKMALLIVVLIGGIVLLKRKNN